MLRKIVLLLCFLFLFRVYAQSTPWQNQAKRVISEIEKELGLTLPITDDGKRSWDTQVRYMKENYLKDPSSIDMYDSSGRAGIRDTFKQYMNSEIKKEELIKVLKQHAHIFKHVTGNAIDIGVDYLRGTEIEAVRRALVKRGYKVLDETNHKIQCLHVYN